MVVALFATHIEAIGRFLKIYGQTNHNEGIAIEDAIQKVVKRQPGSQNALPLSGDEMIKVGDLCLSKYSDGAYYRCKVIAHESQDNVLVHFIDYGNDEILSTKDMISLTALPESKETEYLLTAMAQAKEYVLAGYWNSHWTEQALAEIRSMIVNEVVHTEMFSSVRDFIFINIVIAERGIPDLSQHLIECGVGQVIDLRSQREQLMLIVDGIDQKVEGPMAYTSNTLSMHAKYEVMVSHVQDGPFLFSVQLKHDTPAMETMMKELQRLPLKEFPTDMIVGMACIVRTDVVYRGLITQLGPTSVWVSLVDYGRSLNLPYHNIHAIPERYAKMKLFAIRCTIANYKKLDRYNKQLKERFREIVMGPEGCNLTIKVTPLEGSPNIQYCEIFLGDGTTSVFDELLKMQTKFFELATNEPVPNGFSGQVKVTWCYSPARFYVRQLRKEEEYQRLRIALNEFFDSGEVRPALTEIRIGAICALKANKQWYRTEIMDIKKTEDGQKTLIVSLIDTGRDVEVGLTVMKRLNYDLCQIPPLALECTLYNVKVEENPGTVQQFVRAINLDKHPERVYIMKSLTRITVKSYLVDLLDRGENVIINRLLDGESPLCLDQYYLTEPGTASSTSNGAVMSTVPSSAPTQDLTYVMPLGRVISINLVSWFSVDEFYVHLKEQQISFSEFVQSCQVVPKVPIRREVAKGTIVLTVYATTGLFYRAEIYDYNEKLFKYKVVFADIGVRAIVAADQLFENPFLFTQVPKFSHKCCLVDREKLAGLRDPEAMKRIGAIIQEAQQLACNVKERLKDDLNVIRVTIDGQDLLETIVKREVEEKKKKKTGVGQVNETSGAKKGEQEANNEGVTGMGAHLKANPEVLKNQKLWIKPVDFLSKEVFRFSIKDMQGGGGLGGGSDLFKGAFEKGAVQMGVYTAVEIVRVANQIYHMKPIKEEILPQLLLEDSFSATVSEPPTGGVLNLLSVQLITSLGPLTRLLMDMKKFYEDNAEQLTIDQLKQCQNQFFAVLSADGFWYRAELKNVTEADELLFDLFDYGRQEKVDPVKVRPLDLKFRELNRMSTPMYLTVEQFTEKIATEVIMKEIHHLTKNISLIVRVLENYRGCWIVDIVSNGFGIGQALAEKKLAITCPMALVRKQIDRDLQENLREDEVLPVDAGRELRPVEIGHYDSPERIFVQLTTQLPELRRMQETLQIVAPSLSPIGSARIGELCIAQNSFDGLWYRAKILDSAPDMTSVQFIDYGNTDVITSDKGAKLKRMIDEFAEIPEFAKFCALPMRPAGGGGRRTEWDDEVFTLLSQYMDRPDKECEFLTETKLRRHFIRLFVQGEDIENVLKQHGWGESIQLIRSGSVCYVSHINSLAEFFIQLDVDGTVLDLLSDYFRNADKFQTVAEPVVGSVYAALYEDGEWYRAKISRKAGGQQWDALFIDYGNVATVSSLKEIESREIRDIPPLSRKCKLHLPKNILGVSMEAENLFEEIAQSGVTVMEVLLVNLERDYSVVELSVKETGLNIVEMLPLNINPYEHDPEFDH